MDFATGTPFLAPVSASIAQTFVFGILPFLVFAGIPLAFAIGHYIVHLIRYASAARGMRISEKIARNNEIAAAQLRNSELLAPGDRVLSLDEQRKLTS